MAMEWSERNEPPYQRAWLSNGTMVDVMHDNGGRPGSEHRLSFAVFVRFNLGAWSKACDGRNGSNVRSAMEAIGVCDNAADVIELLTLELPPDVQVVPSASVHDFEGGESLNEWPIWSVLRHLAGFAEGKLADGYTGMGWEVLQGAAQAARHHVERLATTPVTTVTVTTPHIDEFRKSEAQIRRAICNQVELINGGEPTGGAPRDVDGGPAEEAPLGFPTARPANAPGYYRDDPTAWRAWLAGAHWLAGAANDIEGPSANEYSVGDRAMAKLNLLDVHEMRRHRDHGRPSTPPRSPGFVTACHRIVTPECKRLKTKETAMGEAIADAMAAGVKSMKGWGDKANIHIRVDVEPLDRSADGGVE